MEIELTDEQMAKILAATREMGRVEDRYEPVIRQLTAQGWRPYVWHSGGGVWLVRIDQLGFTWENGEHPYVLIDPSETGDGWRIGGYEDYEDEGIDIFIDCVAIEDVATQFGEVWAELHRKVQTRANIEATLALPMTEDEALAWAAEVVHDGRLAVDVEGAGLANRNWVVMVLMGQHTVAFMPADDGLRSTVYWSPMIYMVELEGTAIQRFIVDWHDGTKGTGEWRETFNTYAEAVDYYGDLTKAVMLNKHIDETRPPKRMEPTIVEHFATQHPESKVKVNVWWPVDYGGIDNGRLSKDGKHLVVDYDLSESGESGISGFSCHLCEMGLDLGHLYESAPYEGLEVDWDE